MCLNCKIVSVFSLGQFCSYTMSRLGITNDISYIQIWKLFQHTANDNLIILWGDTLEDVKAFIHMGSIVNIHGQQRKPQERSTTLQVTAWYRRILKIHWAETIINAELWQQTNQEPHEIKRSRTLWKPTFSITRQALIWNPQGKRMRKKP